MGSVPHFRRLLLLLLLVVCVGWRTGSAAPLTPAPLAASPAAGRAWSDDPPAIQSHEVDFDLDGDTDKVDLTVHRDHLAVRVWLNDGRGRLAPLAIADVLDWGPPQLHLTLEHTARIDSSDESDAAAHVEPRAGPVFIRPSRALVAVLSVAPRSHSHSSSTPRAPPARLRFA